MLHGCRVNDVVDCDKENQQMRDKPMTERSNIELELAELVLRCYRALHRGEWEEGETDAELSDRINDVMSNHFGSDWILKI